MEMVEIAYMLIPLLALAIVVSSISVYATLICAKRSDDIVKKRHQKYIDTVFLGSRN